MNFQTKRYLRQLSSHLPCPLWLRRRLIAGFLPTMELYLKENSEPDWTALCEAFGMPVQMARVILEQVPQSERQQHWKIRMTLRCAAALTAVTLVFCCIYVQFFMKTRRTTIYVEYGTVTQITEDGGLNSYE